MLTPRSRFAVAALATIWTLNCDGTTLQSGNSPGVTFEVYPSSVEFCEEHVIGVPGKDGQPGSNLNWSGYYSTDPPEKVVSHYMKALGSENHRKEGDDDVWRFPLDKPVRVLSVTHAKGTFPRGAGCSPPPGSARAIVIMSFTTRPD